MEAIMLHLTSSLRVVWACVRKEMQTAIAEPRSTLLGVFRPVLLLILMSLIAVGGGLDPTAVVMDDTGPYAQQFYTALAQAHSFQLQRASRQEAQDLLKSGRILAVVTIPADFDSHLSQKQAVEVPVQIDNIESDLTNDIRRALPLSITLFYGKAFPNVVTVTPNEYDVYPKDTDYLPYLTVAVLVLALMFAGLMQAGEPAAREWENATIKELLLSPASRFAIVVGKMLGALIVGLLSVVVTLILLILVVGVWPVHFWEVLGFTLLTTLIFTAWGTLLGTLIKQYRAFTLLALSSVLPLFVLSGSFGPISFLNIPIIQVIAQCFPVYYAIVLMQHAFHGFDLNTYGVSLNIAILCAYTVLVLILTTLVFHRHTTAQIGGKR
jgi:ABC-2 type transport system permease protein